MSEDFSEKRSFGSRDDSQEERQGYGANRPSYNNDGRNFRREYRPNTQRPYNKFNGNGEQRFGRTPRPRFSKETGNYQGYSPRYGEQQRPRFSSQGSYRPQQEQYRSSQESFRQETEGRPFRPTPYGNRSYNGGQDSQGRPFAPRKAFRPNAQGYGAQQHPSQAQRPQFKAKKPKFNFGKRRIDYKEVIADPNAPLRLNKYLSNAGVCSRRDADKYINAGVVTVNGVIVTELGTKIYRTDEVRFHGELVQMEKKVYVLLNKPKGYVTTSEDPQNRKTVMDLVRNACPERIYPVGRLDRNTTGVLLLTNDGEMASKLTHPKFLKKKIYHVFLDQNVTAAHLREIAEGITLEDGEIKADQIDYASPTDKKQVGIEIHSGRNRIVRRIFESLGYHVIKLDRVYFSGLTKKNLKRGDWRYLTEQEVSMLRMGAFE